MTDRKDFSTNVFFTCAIVALLSCCSSVSSNFIRPRVTRTSDAVIIDFAGVGYGASHQGKGGYGEIADPLLTPSSINPYAAVQKQPKFPNGWSYFYAHPSDVNPADARATYMQYGEKSESQAVKQGTTTAVQCGRGPATFPTARDNQTPLHSSVSGKVGGGGATEAKKGAWPFMVALQAGVPTCGGVLISESKVLLAAQCLEKMHMFTISTSLVAIGMNTAYPTLDARATRRISKLVIHSGYDATTYANDLAIVTLDSPVAFSKYVAPVCLPAQSTDSTQYVDQSAMVLGWGGGFKLKQGKVSIISNDECRMADVIGQYVTNSTMCINSDNTFTCLKDVGAPVVVMSSPGTWTVVGINSFTNQDTDTDCKNNGLKTRVAAFRSWIDQNMQI